MPRVTNSLDGNESIADLNSVIAEFPNNDDHPTHIPIKKLSDDFESCISKNEDGMKVYLRVRPFNNKSESTIIVESDCTIITNAPESSKRALYTKTECRHYVSKTLNKKLFNNFIQQ